jgi:predicted ATP-grasp superfamily ATP-dependent carboligase
LAQHRIPTVVAATTRWHAAMWSRYAKSYLFGQLSGKPFVDELLRLQRQLGARPVLILTDEMAVHTVSEHRAALSPYYRFQLPAPNMVATLSNKASFYHFAKEHDLPVPRTTIVEGDSDLAAVTALALPLIVKPADKRPVYGGKVERINWLDTTAEVLVVARRMLNAAGTVVVQEWIDGPDSSIYFALFHGGETAPSSTIFFGRKLAAYPPGLGSTAVCVPAPEAAAVLRPLTEKFLAVSQYRGLGSLEFKWDARAQRFVIIEPTVGRTDWQEEIARLNGVNLALVAYRCALGLEPPPPAPPVRAAAWRESVRHFGRGSRLGMPTYDGYWRRDDPLPALAFGVDFAVRTTHRLFTQPLFERRKPPFRKRRVAW